MCGLALAAGENRVLSSCCFFTSLEGSRLHSSRNGRALGRVGHEFHASCSVSVNECLAVLRPPVPCLARRVAPGGASLIPLHLACSLL